MSTRDRNDEGVKQSSKESRNPRPETIEGQSVSILLPVHDPDLGKSRPPVDDIHGPTFRRLSTIVEHVRKNDRHDPHQAFELLPFQLPRLFHRLRSVEFGDSLAIGWGDVQMGCDAFALGFGERGGQGEPVALDDGREDWAEGLFGRDVGDIGPFGSDLKGYTQEEGSVRPSVRGEKRNACAPASSPVTLPSSSLAPGFFRRDRASKAALHFPMRMWMRSSSALCSVVIGLSAKMMVGETPWK